MPLGRVHVCCPYLERRETQQIHGCPYRPPRPPHKNRYTRKKGIFTTPIHNNSIFSPLSNILGVDGMDRWTDHEIRGLRCPWHFQLSISTHGQLDLFKFTERFCCIFQTSNRVISRSVARHNLVALIITTSNSSFSTSFF